MPLSPFKENHGLLLNVLRKRGLSEEQPVPDTLPMAPAAPDAFKLDAMTLEPEDLDIVAPNSAALLPPQPYSLALGTQLLPSSSGFGDPLEEELQPRLSQLVNCANSKDSSSSEEECTTWPADKQIDKETDRQREKSRPKDTERERQRASETMEQVNGQEVKRSERLIKSPSVREEGRVREKRLEKGVESLEEKVDNQEKKRGDKRKSSRQSKRQHKREGEKEAGQKGVTRSGSSANSPAVTPSSLEGVLSDNQVRRLEEITANSSDLTKYVLHAPVYQ